MLPTVYWLCFDSIQVLARTFQIQWIGIHRYMYCVCVLWMNKTSSTQRSGSMTLSHYTCSSIFKRIKFYFYPHIVILKRKTYQYIATNFTIWFDGFGHISVNHCYMILRDFSLFVGRNEKISKILEFTNNNWNYAQNAIPVNLWSLDLGHVPYLGKPSHRASCGPNEWV